MNENLPRVAWTFGFLFALSTVFTAFFVIQTIALQNQVQSMTAENIKKPLAQYQTLGQSVITELIAQSKKDPNLIPILKKYGLPLSPEPSPVTPPAAKKKS